MSNEREMLELAAKAAGMHELTEWTGLITDYDSAHYGLSALHAAGPAGQCHSWNPRDDDGDCARMEAKLMIDVAWHFDRVESDARRTMFSQVAYFDEHNGDRQAARRSASLQIAAAIGKAMP